MHFHKISKKVKPQFPTFKPIKQSKPKAHKQSLSPCRFTYSQRQRTDRYPTIPEKGQFH